MKLLMNLFLFTVIFNSNVFAEKIKFDFDGIEQGMSGSNNSPIIFLTSRQYPQYFYYFYCQMQNPLALVLMLDPNEPESGNLVRAGYSQFEKAEECKIIMDCAAQNAINYNERIEMILDSETGFLRINSLPKACMIPEPAPEEEVKPEPKSDNEGETSESSSNGQDRETFTLI
jgi:hypothetical protein